MKKAMIRALAKLGAVFFALISFLLLDGVLAGSLSILGGACLMPACILLTMGLGSFALHRPARRVPRRRVKTMPVHRQPVLRVVHGTAGGSEPPHAA